MAKGRRPTNTGATAPRSESDTTKLSYANEEGGCATTESEGTRMRRSWGKDSFLPPNKRRPEHPPAGGNAKKRRVLGI